MRVSFFYFPLSLRLSLAPFQSAFAWGEPHHAITGAAVEVLPAWQKELLGEEVARLGDSYCMIPDHVFTDKANAKFAQMESAPGEVYLKILHLPTQQPEYLEVIRYFMERAVLSLREGNVGNASRYMGTICHQIEDYGSPSHTVPGDNMFTLLQQFLPPSAAMQDQLMHGPIENGDFAVSIAEYHPVLLGTTVNEASWRLMHRIHEAILNARSTTIPIMQALYAEDQASVVKHQLRAAVVDAQVVADAMYTILCLGAERDLAAEEMVRIDEFFPLEAASLYYPQSEFFSAPHWGYPRRGLILAGGKKAVPLKLRLETGEQEFRNGISAGMGKSLTFLLPREVYRRFTVQAGLHPELGALGRVEFTIAGDGKPLASVIVGGADSAKTLECEIAGVNRLQLSLASRGIDAKSAYAIWADPILWK
jgi:hypothetical protein